MNKFKVGDKVKIIASFHNQDVYLIGEIGTILDIVAGYYSVRVGNNIPYHYTDEELILISNKPKRYDMDKWLEDNQMYLNKPYKNQIQYFQMRNKEFDIEHPFNLENFNTSIIQWIDYVNTLGANLSYPEEIKEPEFDFVDYMVDSEQFIQKQDNLYGQSEQIFLCISEKIIFKNNGYFNIKFTKQNADALIALDKHIQEVVERLEK